MPNCKTVRMDLRRIEFACLVLLGVLGLTSQFSHGASYRPLVLFLCNCSPEQIEMLSFGTCAKLFSRGMVLFTFYWKLATFDKILLEEKSCVTDIVFISIVPFKIPIDAIILYYRSHNIPEVSMSIFKVIKQPLFCTLKMTSHTGHFAPAWSSSYLNHVCTSK